MTTTARALQCPHCGGAVVIRAMQHTQTVVCGACSSVLDAKDPGLRVLQQFKARLVATPLIPLGTRGRWHGQPYEVVGFQVRTIEVDGIPYSWREYLLFNPYRGFRYLTEYDGHWNDVTTIKSLPVTGHSGTRPTATVLGETFSHFQTATAKTTFVLGEFPWQVRVGDVAVVQDFVAPPRMLSSESTPDETTWSVGEYVSGARVWEAFKVPAHPPTPRGVFANQPSPFGSRSRALWRIFGMLVTAVVLLMGARLALARNELVHTGQYVFRPGVDAGAFVTPTFRLAGRTSNVELVADTDLSNNWVYLDFALINDSTGTAYDFGREVSYYSGYDSDGSWTEGSRRDRVRIPTVPPGPYYLRVAPEGSGNGTPVHYTLRVWRDSPSAVSFGIALLLILLPPLFVALRQASFEASRWRESDYAPGDDEDDE